MFAAFFAIMKERMKMLERTDHSDARRERPVDDLLYEKCLEFSLKWEGGYVDHPRDPGGATNRGITQRTYTAWRKAKKLPWRAVARITGAEVKEIYRARYWRKSGADRCPFMIAAALFDFAIHSGPRRAVRYLQQCIHVKQDGVFGPITKAALDARLDYNARNVAAEYISRRRRFLKGLRTYRYFGRGWMNRIDDLRRFVGIS